MTDSHAAGARVIAGRYVVRELLGRGGMATVHRCTDLRLDRTVALKLLRPDLVSDQSTLYRFRKEARSAARLNHPSIVGVYDSGEDTGVDEHGRPCPIPFIVMECVEGRTVREILHSRDGVTTHLASGVDVPTQMSLSPEELPDVPPVQGLEIGEAVKLTAGVLSALEYSHEMDIVHRDIKPGNVLVSLAGDVKVMDFGIARVLSDAAATQTSTEQVVGTAQYLSPEQARNEDVDTRTDLYSAGCLLYELLTGRTPFLGDTPVAIAYQHVAEQAHPPSTHRAGIPEALDRVVLKALAKKRDDRYSTAGEFRRELMAAYTGGNVSAPGAGDYATPPDSPTESMPPLAAAVRYSSGPALQPKADPSTGPQPAVPPEHERASRRRRVWGYVATGVTLAILAAGAVAIVAQTLLGAPAPPPAAEQTVVRVPDVAGLDPVQAIAALREAGLDPERGDDVFSTDPVGFVVRTDPQAGRETDKGDTVEFVVSKGPEEISLPNVLGWTEESAITALEAAGLVVIGAERVDGMQPEGTVVSLNPPIDTKVAPGSEVTINISSGRIVLPDLRGQSLASARASLGELSLESVINYTDTTDVPAGRVVSHSPAAGRVRPYSMVRLVIARAPAPEPTPTTAPPTTTPAPEPTATTPAPTPTETPTPTQDPIPTITASPVQPTNQRR